MRCPTALLAAGAALLVLTSGALGQGKIIDLRPKWEKGQQIRYRMEQSSSGKVTSGTAPAPATGKKPRPRPTTTPSPDNPGDDAALNLDQSMVQAVDLRMKVIDADPEGGAVVHLIYDSLKLSLDSGGTRTDFDSATPREKDGDNPLAAAARQIVGTTLVLTLDRDGNITKVEGGETLVPAGLGGVSPAGALTDPNAVKETFGPIFTIRPTKGQAAIGETWTTTDSLDTSLIGSFLITTENRLKSATARSALVEFKGKITPGPESAGAAGIQIKDSRHDGTYTWDTQRGQLMDLGMTQSATIEANLAGSTVTSTQESKTTIRRMN